MKTVKIKTEDIRLYRGFELIFEDVARSRVKINSEYIVLCPCEEGFELTKGYSLYKNAILNNVETLPAIIEKKEQTEDMFLQRAMAEINPRPTEYAKAVKFYIEACLLPADIKKRTEQDRKCSEFFGISTSTLNKYAALLKMTPELQSLSDDPRFPFTAFVSAHRLTAENQMRLYKILSNISSKIISRSFIENTIQEILTEQGDKIAMPGNNKKDRGYTGKQPPRKTISLARIIEEYNSTLEGQEDKATKEEKRNEDDRKEVDNGVFCYYLDDYPPSEEKVDDVLKNMIANADSLHGIKANGVQMAYMANVIVKLMTIIETNSNDIM